jgi:hypothetical protein
MSSIRLKVATGVVWGLAWLGTLVCWALFLCDILVWRDAKVVTACVVASIPAPLVGWLAYRGASRPLWQVTGRAALYALGFAVAVVIIPPASVSLSDVRGMIFVAGRAYAAPLALGLSGVALKMFWPQARVVHWALVYILLGAFLLLPIPPISTRTYNPVGFFFPVWGIGAPLCVTIAGLVRRPREDTTSADPEDQI